MDEGEYTSLVAALAGVGDPCQARGRRYPWEIRNLDLTRLPTRLPSTRSPQTLRGGEIARRGLVGVVRILGQPILQRLDGRRECGDRRRPRGQQGLHQRDHRRRAVGIDGKQLLAVDHGPSLSARPRSGTPHPPE